MNNMQNNLKNKNLSILNADDVIYQTVSRTLGIDLITFLFKLLENINT